MYKRQVMSQILFLGLKPPCHYIAILSLIKRSWIVCSIWNVYIYLSWYIYFSYGISNKFLFIKGQPKVHRFFLESVYLPPLMLIGSHLDSPHLYIEPGDLICMLKFIVWRWDLSEISSESAHLSFPFIKNSWQKTRQKLYYSLLHHVSIGCWRMLMCFASIKQANLSAIPC